MRKHPGLVSRRRPSFDALEERALLSGGHPGSIGLGEMFWSSPHDTVHSEPMSLGRPGSNQAPWSQGGWSQSPDEFWPSQPGGSTEYPPDGDIPSQPAASSPFQQPVAGPVIPSGSFPQSGPASAPSLAVPSNFVFVTGSSATVATKGQTGATEPELTGTISLDSQATGNAGKEPGTAASGGKESGQEPVGPAMASPPAQLFSFLDADSALTRLVSSGEAAARGNQLAANGPGGGSRAENGHPGAPITSRGALLSTAHVSGDLRNGNSLDEWPPPSSADLIASALPFDRAALDRAIDLFFQQFDDVSRGDLAGQGLAHIILYSMALASTFGALDVVRRRWRLTTTGKCVRVGHPRATADHIGFPELPGSWSSRLS